MYILKYLTNITVVKASGNPLPRVVWFRLTGQSNPETSNYDFTVNLKNAAIVEAQEVTKKTEQTTSVSVTKI